MGERKGSAHTHRVMLKWLSEDGREQSPGEEPLCGCGFLSLFQLRRPRRRREQKSGGGFRYPVCLSGPDGISATRGRVSAVLSLRGTPTAHGTAEEPC